MVYYGCAVLENAVRACSAHRRLLFRNRFVLLDAVCVAIGLALGGYSLIRYTSADHDRNHAICMVVTGVRLALRAAIFAVIANIVTAYDELQDKQRVVELLARAPTHKDCYDAMIAPSRVAAGSDRSGEPSHELHAMLKMLRRRAKAGGVSLRPPDGDELLQRAVRDFVEERVKTQQGEMYGFAAVGKDLGRLIAASSSMALLATIALLMTVYASIDPVNSYVLGILFSELEQGSFERRSSAVIYGSCGALGGLYVIRVVSMVLLQRLQARLSASAMRELRARLVSRSVHADPVRLEFAAGDLHLNARFSSDVTRVAGLLDKLVWNLLLPVIQLVVSLVYLFIFFWTAGVLACALVPLAFAAGPKDTAAAYSATYSRELGRANGAFDDAVGFSAVAHSFGAQQLVEGKLMERVDELRTHEFNNTWWSASVYTVQLAMIWLWIAVQTIFLALSANQGTYSAADFSSLAALVTSLGNPAIKLSGFIWVALGSAGSLKSVSRALSLLQDAAAPRRVHPNHPVNRRTDGLVDGAALATAKEPEGGVTAALVVEGLRLSFPGADRPALNGVSLNIRQGEFVACVGPSGCGKTSILRCVTTSLGVDLATYDTLEVGGIPADQRPLPDSVGPLGVGVVPQTSAVLPGLSVKDNVVCGYAGDTADSRDERVEEALRAAGCAEFVAALPSGADTVMGPEGCGLSGGQLQRVCLARALFRRPALLVLDEATSALDPETERDILATLTPLGCAIFFVTHNLANARSADRIVVVDGGRVVEEGDYDTLEEKDGVFAAMLRAGEGGGGGLLPEG